MKFSNVRKLLRRREIVESLDERERQLWDKAVYLLLANSSYTTLEGRDK